MVIHPKIVQLVFLLDILAARQIGPVDLKFSGLPDSPMKQEGYRSTVPQLCLTWGMGGLSR
jgi:hypothetical protein